MPEVAPTRRPRPLGRSAVGALLTLTSLLTLAAPDRANAHKTNLATGEVRVSGGEVIYRLRVSAHDLAVALGIETDLVAAVPAATFESRREALARYLQERLVVLGEKRQCAAAAPALDYALLPEDLLITLRYDCPAPVVRLGIRYALFFDLDPTHRSLGRVILPRRAEPFVFDRSLTALDIDVTAATGARAGLARFGRVLWLGVEHIVTGYDHLLFLLALLIRSTLFWQMVRMVSAFTVAHSLTLGLAWYGILAPPARLVEVAIAASIAWVAVENMFGRVGGHRWLLAGGFGLIHGLGFYGALKQLGLEEAGLVTTLLGFNLGVEVGQVGVVALVWGPLLWWTRQKWYDPSAGAASTAILLVALWWMIQRTAAS